MSELELGRRERKKEETKQRIVNVALELFQKNGFETTTVDEIAARADVAKGTFFNYFPRKESILDEIHDMHLDEIEAVTEELLAGDRPAVEVMFEISRRSCEIYTRDRELSRLVILNVMRGPSGESAKTAETNERIQNLVRRYVRRAVATGELRKDLDVERVTSILRGNFFFTMLIWLCCPVPPYDLQEELDARSRVILEGLVPGGAK